MTIYQKAYEDANFDHAHDFSDECERGTGEPHDWCVLMEMFDMGAEMHSHAHFEPRYIEDKYLPD